jgi:hypothetical protein
MICDDAFFLDLTSRGFVHHELGSGTRHTRSQKRPPMKPTGARAFSKPAELKTGTPANRR